MASDDTGHATDGPILVIGYGNALRGDDGLGPRVAETIARWRLPGVVALAVHQLVPELAEPIADARLVLFVDARMAGESDQVDEQTLEAHSGALSLAHVSDPSRLLALARDAFGRCPPAWVISVPAYDVGLGERLSERAESGVQEAIRRIARLLHEHGIDVTVPDR